MSLKKHVTQGIKEEVSHIAKFFIRKGIFPQQMLEHKLCINKQKKRSRQWKLIAVLYAEKRGYHCVCKANDLSILHHVLISDLPSHSLGLLLLSPFINKESEQQK